MTIEVRRARAEDLGAVNEIFHDAQSEHDEEPPPRAAGGLPIFRHHLAHAEVWVATEGDRTIGFSASVARAGTAFLSDLFIRPDRRSHGVGRALLARCFDDRGLPRSTLSSSDPRALALYVGLGLDPRWPLFYVLGEPSGVRTPEEPVRTTEVDAREIVEIDGALSGRERAEDVAFWAGECRAFFLRSERGYVVVRRRSDDWIGHDDAITIGPAGGATPEDGVAVILAAVRAVAASGKRIRIGVSGPHPVLRPLLALGFGIAELDTFCAVPGPLAFDPTRYLPSGGVLF